MYKKYSTTENALTKNSYAKNYPIINAAFTTPTWAKHSAALTCLKTFELIVETICTWPLSNDDINNFCYWALTVKKLKYSTVSAYISSFSLAHKLKGMDNSACYNFTTNLMLRGAENLTLYKTMQ